MSVILNDHQVKAVYKLFNSDEHGLLLWWNMGTGKTLAGITSILNYPGYDIVILCPSYINFMWKNELNKIKRVKNNIKYYDYDNINKFLTYDLKNKIVIIDEAHNLIPKCRKNNIKDSQIIKHLNSCYKIVLLTGTPFNYDIMECTQLINIAAGRTILPYNIKEFTDKYYIINKEKAVYRGYIIEIMSKLTSMKIYKDIINPFVSFSLIFSFLVVYYISIMIKYDINEYKKIKTHKFLNDCKNYIHYYDNTVKDTVNFPKVNIHYKKIEYSYYQIKMWLTLTQSILPVDYVKKLDITSYDDIDYYSQKLNSREYLKKGALIGNLEENDFPKKFYNILNMSKGKRAVFYSGSYNSGLKLFAHFLKNMGEKYIILEENMTSNEKFEILNKFKNQTIFLLLHPVYIEGITIYGAEQLHIIEPLDSFSSTKQLMGRVARYKTHSHLPENERKVDIYQWICTCAHKWTSVENIAKKQFLKLYTWFKYRKEVFYTLSAPSEVSQDITPDLLLMMKTKELFNITDEISEYFYENDENIDVECCIKYPSLQQEILCKKNRKSCKRKKIKQIKS